MTKLVFIGDLLQMSDSGSYGFAVECAGRQADGFVVPRDGECIVYGNSCPHSESPLEWESHRFFDAEGAMIQGAVHDARFLIDTGECVLALAREQASNRYRSGLKTVKPSYSALRKDRTRQPR